MNTQNLDLQEQIDLLVDGELPQAQRALLFHAVGDVAGGWRNCAMAFVEAQALGEGLAQLPSESGEGSSMSSWWRRGGLAAALAAAFLAGRMLDVGPAAEPVVDAGAVEEFAPPAMPPERPAVFQPMVAVNGAPAYATHEMLPEFVLQALVQAGHRVQQLERTVLLEGSDGGEMELPLLETRIVDMRPQAL